MLCGSLRRSLRGPPRLAGELRVRAVHTGAGGPDGKLRAVATVVLFLSALQQWEDIAIREAAESLSYGGGGSPHPSVEAAPVVGAPAPRAVLMPPQPDAEQEDGRPTPEAADDGVQALRGGDVGVASLVEYTQSNLQLAVRHVDVRQDGKYHGRCLQEMVLHNAEEY